MTADQIFSIANPLAVLGWILLALFPGRRSVTRAVAGTALPAVFAAAYVAIAIAVFPRANGSFSTLAGVGELFTNQWLLLAGWLHYLAFDLLIGAWEARDSVERGIPRWALVPCLFLTLMFGPAGWLAYWIVRLRHSPKSLVASPGSRVRSHQS
jgi:hypothetical protein